MYNMVCARDGQRQVKLQLDFKKFQNFFRLLGHCCVVVNRLSTIVCAIVERARCKLFNRQSYLVACAAWGRFSVSSPKRAWTPDGVIPGLGTSERFFQSKV